eukprot:360241-Chlamydomonas_euryale.AAC.1
MTRAWRCSCLCMQSSSFAVRERAHLRQLALPNGVCRPEAACEHGHGHVDALWQLGAELRRLPKRRHHVGRQLNVLEHALQLVGELAATLGLELAYHALLRVDRRRLAQQQALGQVLFVERLKHVLALQSEDPSKRWPGQTTISRSSSGKSAGRLTIMVVGNPYEIILGIDFRASICKRPGHDQLARSMHGLRPATCAVPWPSQKHPGRFRPRISATSILRTQPVEASREGPVLALPRMCPSVDSSSQIRKPHGQGPG